MILNTLEKFLILAQHSSKGRWMISEIHLNYGIIGSVLLNMTNKGLLQIENKFLRVQRNSDQSNPLKDPISIEVLNTIHNSKKKRKINQWVRRFSKRSKAFKWMTLTTLEKAGVFKIEHKKFLFIPYKICHLTKPSYKLQLVQELRECILNGAIATPEETTLLSMIEACKMHKVIANDRKDVKQMRKALKLFVQQNPIAESMSKTIQEIQVGIAAAVAASTIATTSS